LGIVILVASGWLPSVQNNDASNIAEPGAFYSVIAYILAFRQLNTVRRTQERRRRVACPPQRCKVR